LAGLYVGEAGIGAALLRAGQCLDESRLIEAASKRGRWIATQPFRSPDLFNGAAGRIRFHLLLWDATGGAEHLRAAITAGDWLVAQAQETEHGDLRWRMPRGFESLSGCSCLGYAHGAAGIGDSLLDLFEATADERFLTAAQAAGRWLSRFALRRHGPHGGLDWPELERDAVTAPFWCRGATGIGRFFLHGSTHRGFPAAADIAAQAGSSAGRGARWASPTQCHGLAGNIELLLDLYQATGITRHYSEAQALGGILDSWKLDREQGLMWPSEDGVTCSPDYLVGYAGVAMCLLRLADPAHAPTQLSRAGFRFKPLVLQRDLS
jgi:lantibiotic modifying enzyme